MAESCKREILIKRDGEKVGWPVSRGVERWHGLRILGSAPAKKVRVGFALDYACFLLFWES